MSSTGQGATQKVPCGRKLLIGGGLQGNELGTVEWWIMRRGEQSIAGLGVLGLCGVLSLLTPHSHYLYSASGEGTV